MSDEHVPVKYQDFSPEQCGWVRRPDQDTELVEAWERPDGKLFAHEKNAPRLTLRRIEMATFRP